MKLFGRDLTGFPKALVVLVAVLLVAIGLCTVNDAIEKANGWGFVGPEGASGFPNTAFADFIAILDWAGAGAIVVSVAGLVFVILAWPAEFLYDKFRRPDRDKLQKLMTNSEHDEGDEGTTR